jgi:hypothetical protein
MKLHADSPGRITAPDCSPPKRTVQILLLPDFTSISFPDAHSASYSNAHPLTRAVLSHAIRHPPNFTAFNACDPPHIFACSGILRQSLHRSFHIYRGNLDPFPAPACLPHHPHIHGRFSGLTLRHVTSEHPPPTSPGLTRLRQTLTRLQTDSPGFTLLRGTSRCPVHIHIHIHPACGDPEPLPPPGALPRPVNKTLSARLPLRATDGSPQASLVPGASGAGLSCNRPIWQ